MRTVEKERDVTFKESTIETIDNALLNWVRGLNLHVQKAEKFVNVEVLWESAERSFQYKNDKDLRDRNKTLIYPKIYVKRDSIKQQPDKMKGFVGNQINEFDYQGGALVVSKKINQKQTSKFQNAHSKLWNGQKNSRKNSTKVVYDYRVIPMPTYVQVDYTLTLKTSFQQHMNSLLQPFITTGGNLNYFLIQSDTKLYYEAFMAESFETEFDQKEENERIFTTLVKIEVLGYLIGNEVNETKKRLATRQNAVDAKVVKGERVVYPNEKYVINKERYTF